MEQSNDIFRMLDMMERPGFCVENCQIIKVNKSAAQMVAVGESIDQYLHIGANDYADFSSGCLYLTLMLAGKPAGASVTRVGSYDIFLLEQEEDRAELQAMALAARELREPLANVMTTADQLFPLVAEQDDPATQDQVARLNRGLFQMLRVICNMSDANRYCVATFRPETLDICAFLEEVFQKSRELAAHAGVTLTFSNLSEQILCLVDSEKLERAILNIISNAMKFTPRGGTIAAKLIRKGRSLCLTIQDSGEGLDDSAKGNIFNRFLRQPAIEDGRFGIGLGMVLIRSAATQHGGTVLIDQPEEGGTRITMTLAIRQSKETIVRSPVFLVDYAGGRDHGLIELSDCLPASSYESGKIN